jgi:hypothetical protein
MPPPGRPKGSRRVHAELTLGRSITVGFHAVELLTGPGWPAGRDRAARSSGVGCDLERPLPTWSTAGSLGPARTSCG